jgi:Leucine-rich repeat (LRR) protein
MSLAARSGFEVGIELLVKHGGIANPFVVPVSALPNWREYGDANPKLPVTTHSPLAMALWAHSDPHEELATLLVKFGAEIDLAIPLVQSDDGSETLIDGDIAPHWDWHVRFAESLFSRQSIPTSPTRASLTSSQPASRISPKASPSHYPGYSASSCSTTPRASRFPFIYHSTGEPLKVLDIQQDMHMPLLHQAALHGHHNIVRILMALGANACLPTTYWKFPSCAPLHLASGAGHERCVRELIFAPGSSIDLNQRDNVSRTPLHYAAEKGHSNIIRLLIFSKGDINPRRQYSNETPLHLAAREGNIAAVGMLLENGADWRSLSSEQRTPLSYACQIYKSLSTLLSLPVSPQADGGSSVSDFASETFNYYNTSGNNTRQPQQQPPPQHHHHHYRHHHHQQPQQQQQQPPPPPQQPQQQSTDSNNNGRSASSNGLSPSATIPLPRSTSCGKILHSSDPSALVVRPVRPFGSAILTRSTSTSSKCLDSIDHNPNSSPPGLTYQAQHSLTAPPLSAILSSGSSSSTNRHGRAKNEGRLAAAKRILVVGTPDKSAWLWALMQQNTRAIEAMLDCTDGVLDLHSWAGSPIIAAHGMTQRHTIRNIISDPLLVLEHSLSGILPLASRIVSLDLSNNRLNQLTPQLLQLSQLQTLSLASNCLKLTGNSSSFYPSTLGRSQTSIPTPASSTASGITLAGSDTSSVDAASPPSRVSPFMSNDASSLLQSPMSPRGGGDVLGNDTSLDSFCIIYPDWIPHLPPSITSLNLSSNQISCLPDELVARLPNLRSLSLQNNKLTAIPRNLLFMEQLEEFSFTDNPLHNAAEARIVSGPNAISKIREYLQDMLQDEGEYHTKVQAASVYRC